MDMFPYLGWLLGSFALTSTLIVPYINFLYKLKMRRQVQHTLAPTGGTTPIFDKFHNIKAGTPVGGGFLILVVVGLMFLMIFPSYQFMGMKIKYVLGGDGFWELAILFFTFISFGILGLYDDIIKTLKIAKTGVFGLSMKHKFIIQIFLGLAIGSMFYFGANVDLIHISGTPWALHIGWLFIPLVAVIVVGFANAMNITDGLDGLSSGLLTIALFIFWMIAQPDVDTPLSVFLAIWIGALMAFLYFNVYPARIWLGDVGSMSFGATLAVVALLLGKIVVLLIIGGLFILEAGSSLIQMVSKKYYGRKILPAAPIHLTLQHLGWEEPKIVTRAWLAAIMLGIFGLWLTMFSTYG